ncbi:rhomboid family intramembrane serine protease [Leptolyngbya sp. FACHB-261]|uniref:rhomboid family intramembrane serine protease n=1 Tax=Leptolyngbya sp. FACHB-261 TaxID=2692806 RepID=UPI001684646E|nr:rhomboid family intramembrane serine protease [Leptolyngbya sp. FACHB-261]MBD2102036.1 rhomboid family intramembrane serine protease [Leptolyngbya sp. FACHB-261]
MSQENTKAITQELKVQALILGSSVAIFWLLELADLFVFGGSLDLYGIRPHSLLGLRGILFAPFLHGGMGHLIANTVPFVVLGWLTMLHRTRDFFVVTVVTQLVSGFGVWLFGSPNSIHIGASGLIFGYLGFLLLRGYFERRLGSILVSLVVGILYGSLVWGVLPSSFGISWQGHLFGFLGGVLAARLLARRS